jgi:hypothetical protein
VVENGCLRGTRGGPVVVACDRVEELCENRRVEVATSLLDHAQSEMDVAEQPAFFGLAKRRPGAELANASQVVEERCCEQEIVAEAWMELCRLAAERRDSDRVLEETTRVAVMTVGACSRE